MQLVVPIAVNAADAAAMMILSRISPHDVFFILLFFFLFTADSALFIYRRLRSVYLPQITQISQIFYL